ncbi:hypothetical protein EC988_001572 [Linderina pennispora]|nr:hypothetical protein EC988_001572 [Linderina pennispora]
MVRLKRHLLTTRMLALAVLAGLTWATTLLLYQQLSFAYRRRHVADKGLSGLAILLPVTNNTDMQFYHNMWVGDYLHPVCDFDGPGCSIVCNRNSTYQTLDKKTICFSRAIQQGFSDAEFFIKLDDDALVDRDYIHSLMRRYRGYRQPLYISDFILNLDHRTSVLDGTYYGNGKFYMFNRKLVECMDTDIDYRGRRNEDAVFGSMVHRGCGKSVTRVLEDDAKIWHKTYQNKNKLIDLAALKPH